MMPGALDIYRSAAVLIREHGEDTVLEAASRAAVGAVDPMVRWRSNLR